MSAANFLTSLRAVRAMLLLASDTADVLLFALLLAAAIYAGGKQQRLPGTGMPVLSTATMASTGQ